MDSFLTMFHPKRNFNFFLQKKTAASDCHKTLPNIPKQTKSKIIISMILSIILEKKVSELRA